MLLNATTRRDIDINIIGVVGVGWDITEIREQEQTLQQVPKIEAVGQLTGGIAHEFSNFLHVIIGNLRLLKDDLVGQPEVVCEILNDAISAAVDGAELTAKLLSFSRSKLLVATSADLHNAINNVVRFLSRTLAENVLVKTQL